jgi:gamma-glutamyltranspeptidase/glutathione hydrolase
MKGQDIEFEYPWSFEGRRSAVMARNGMVATSQPLAAQAGIQMLQSGGTAADAAIAAAATLGVVEPHMTGIGGDAFALTHFDGEYAALNGSGPAPSNARLDRYRQKTDFTSDDGTPVIPTTGGLPVTVPGALDAWQRLIDRYGTLSLAETLQPAIEHARNGVPATELIAHQLSRHAGRIRSADPTGPSFLADAEAVSPGDQIRNRDLADTLEWIASEGTSVLYGGDLGAEVVAAVDEHGGPLSLADLEAFESTWVDPVTTQYHGVQVLEHPPNTQGLIALEALNIASALDLSADPLDPDRLHHLIEAMKIAFADGRASIADPRASAVPSDQLLSSEHAKGRAGEIGHRAARYTPRVGEMGADTVYVAAVDADGNAVSFLNSIYYPFGSGIVVRGVPLQNRGAAFSLDPDHPNALAPGTRPFHTNTPAMLRADGEFRAAWGIMGGPMQPQGHLQFVVNLIDSELNPQAALDAPRFRWRSGLEVALETTRMPDGVVTNLRGRGHRIVDEQTLYDDGDSFGGGQCVYRTSDGALIGGSDPRLDGQAIGY